MCFKSIKAGMLLALLCCVPNVYAADVTMNFKNADIRAFIEFAAGFTGKNFLVDNRVKGQVTIISPTPMNEKEAYKVFLSVLEVNGFATVESGSVSKIVPRAESKQKAVPVHGGQAENDDTMVTQVLRLKYADSQQLVGVIRPLISPNSHLVAYPRGNMLLLTDSSSNVRRIQKILTLLDRKDTVGVKIFVLQHASADKLVTVLSKLYPAPPNSPSGVKAIAHQPGNILVVVAAPQVVNEVASLVERLDIAPESDSGRLQVRYLKHANAENVAKVINELVSAQTASGGKPTQQKNLFLGAVKVVADPATNAVLMTADPVDIASVNHIIDKLDVRRRQVLIEALIVEVSANTAQQFGMEWNALSNPTQAGRTPFGGTSFSNQAGSNINTVATNPFAGGGGGLVAGVSGGTITFGGVQVLQLGALVRALEAQADTNVLSTPNLLTMDNEEAEIVVGQNVPFITGKSASTGAANPNPFQTIQRKDIGLTLRVKPQISEGDVVRLQIYQEISSIATNVGVQGSDLITNKRSIKTVVLANNGQMIVLGGLMRDDSSISVQGVPCLARMPLLGEAFKFTENGRRKTNLMVFLKPHIIKTSNQIEAITNQKYNDIRALYERPVEGGTILFPQAAKRMPDTLQPHLKSDGTILEPERGSNDAVGEPKVEE